MSLFNTLSAIIQTIETKKEFKQTKLKNSIDQKINLLHSFLFEKADIKYVKKNIANLNMVFNETTIKY